MLKKNNWGTGTHEEAVASCRDFEDSSRAATKDESAALFYNRSLFGLVWGASTWTASRTASDPNQAWLISMYSGELWHTSRTYPAGVQCVKR